MPTSHGTYKFAVITNGKIIYSGINFGIEIEIEMNILILTKSRVINIVAGPLAIITPIICTDMKPIITLNQPRIKPAVRKLKQKHFETIGVAISK